MKSTLVVGRIAGQDDCSSVIWRGGFSLACTRNYRRATTHRIAPVRVELKQGNAQSGNRSSDANNPAPSSAVNAGLL
jgi:hypothetical protein